MRNNRLPIVAFLALLALAATGARGPRATTSLPVGKAVWNPDLGDGRYRNPVLFADYSDPDAIRVGDDFYLVSSSFGSVPGLPILHSKDLVNWTIAGHAVEHLPSPDFDTPQHGKGIWAPSLRHHAGKFWIYVGDPDRGIYVTTATDARGPWSKLTLMKPAKGAIDPCPLWDDDGKMYLVHAWAKSRAGFNSVLTVTPLSADGQRTNGEDVQVFDGHANHPTIEGPKFYKRNGFYYIFAPAGGVATGWQTVLRSKNLYGPYEDRVVLRQGASNVNGPHQGGWVETKSGESWFLHFQDRGAYGRVVHLQPMTWKSDWPVIGADPDGDGVGEPVTTFRKPSVGSVTPAVPQTSDEFDAVKPSLQWQWNANPQPGWFSLDQRPGFLRLFATQKPKDVPSVFGLGNLFLQKVAAEEFTATTRVDGAALGPGGSAGLVIAGRDTAAVVLARTPKGYAVRLLTGRDVEKDGADFVVADLTVTKSELWLRATVEKAEAKVAAEERPLVRFSYGLDGSSFLPLGEAFRARPGVWVGARIGVLATADSQAASAGRADFDWFHVEPLR